MNTEIIIFAEYIGNEAEDKNGNKITLTVDNILFAIENKYKILLKSVYDMSKEDKDFIFEYDRCRRTFHYLGVGTEYETKSVVSESRNYQTSADAMLQFQYEGKEHQYGSTHQDWCRISSLKSVPYLKQKGYDMGSYWLDGDDLVKHKLAKIIKL